MTNKAHTHPTTCLCDACLETMFGKDLFGYGTMITGAHPSIPKGSTWKGMQQAAAPVPPPQTTVRSNHTTLDAAWTDAHQLGRVNLEENHNQTECEAAIWFKTRAGSTITARGKGTTALQAMNAALDEALALKAGVIFADKD